MANARYGFFAEYLRPSPAYDEFEHYLQLEFGRRSPGWRPTFGKLNRYDRLRRSWNYAFLLKGEVPEAATLEEAKQKAGRLVHELTTGMRAAHANPGSSLPDPVIRVWEWGQAA